MLSTAPASTPSSRRAPLAAAILALSLCGPASAAVELDTLFQDHAVLQRERPIAVKGRATPGERLKVSFGGVSVDGTAGADGRFSIDLPAMGASAEGRELVVTGTSGEARAKDVLVGEVWFCSGQSNMEWPVDASDDSDMAKRVAPTLPIRSFKAPHRTANTPEARTPGEWRLASPATVGSFTAVGFWFGADLSKALEVPVGLVDVSWGGTRIEPWIPLDALSSHPRFKRVGDGMAQRIAEHAALTDEMKEERLARFNSAYARAAEQYWTKVLDGEPGMTAGWDKPEGAAGWPDAWKSVTLPANFSAIDPSLASYDGTVWFTREFEVPESMARRACRIELGAIDDSDVVWCVEGRAGDRIGEWNAPRSYSVARGLPAGKQRLTVCVLDTSGEGGFIGRADEMRVVLADGSQSISLAGEWKWRQGARVPAVEAPQRRDPNTTPGLMPTDPAAIYNALVAPCIEFPARGVIWYQGESNAGEHENYRFLQPLLADSWRQKSGNPDLAWGVVQLAAFMKFVESEPAQGGWAWIRESQFRGIREAGGGMASAIDLGDADDIHPRRKREVGERLALWAKNRVYGDTTVAWQGPELSKCRRDGSKVVCEFDHADGLRATSGEPGGFALAGADGVFVWARATIQGTRVVLEAPGVTDPVEAVYAWQNNPERANLANGAGLPAVPFRSAVAAKD